MTTQITSAASSSTRPTPLGRCPHRVPRDAERSFDELFDACAADDACAAAYPDLASRFDALVTALDEEPLMVPVSDVFSGDPYEAALDGAGLIGLTFQALYSADLIPLLPGLIAELEGGETATASSLLTNFLAQGEFLSLGALASVQCREEFPSPTPTMSRRRQAPP